LTQKSRLRSLGQVEDETTSIMLMTHWVENRRRFSKPKIETDFGYARVIGKRLRLSTPCVFGIRLFKQMFIVGLTAVVNNYH